MKQALRPGAELDILTESELRKVVNEVMGGQTLEPSQVRGIENGKVAADGTLNLPLYTAPAGMGFFLNRLLVRIDGATVAAPFTAAGAMLEVLRNDLLVDFKSLVAAAAVPAGLPALLTYGEDSAEWFANGDTLAVRLTAVTAGANIVANFKGVQTPIPVGN